MYESVHECVVCEHECVSVCVCLGVREYHKCVAVWVCANAHGHVQWSLEARAPRMKKDVTVDLLGLLWGWPTTPTIRGISGKPGSNGRAFPEGSASCQREEGNKCVGHQEELIAEANTGLGRQRPVHRTELLSL